MSVAASQKPKYGKRLPIIFCTPINIITKLGTSHGRRRRWASNIVIVSSIIGVGVRPGTKIALQGICTTARLPFGRQFVPSNLTGANALARQHRCKGSAMRSTDAPLQTM